MQGPHAHRQYHGCHVCTTEWPTASYHSVSESYYDSKNKAPIAYYDHGSRLDIAQSIQSNEFKFQKLIRSIQRDFLLTLERPDF